MSQKWLNVIAVMVLLASMASACVIGTGFEPDVYVSPTGSDSNDCWSAATACATVDRALSRLSDLGVVHFSAGEYPLTSSITGLHGLTGITFRGEGSSTTTLYSPPSGGAVLRFSTPVLIQIYDLAFDGRDTPSGTLLGSRGILSGTGAIVRVQDCLFNGLSRGIENNGGFLYVHSSQFTDNSIGILNSNDHSAFTTIDASQFRANLYAIQHMTGRMKIAGSTFVDNGTPPSDALRPETVQNGDRMSISDSFLEGDAYFAIFNLQDGDLKLTNVEISGGEGIGIENHGMLTADHLTITGKPGGGFVNADDPDSSSSDATLSHSSISGNGSFGIKNQHYLTLLDSVVQGNDGDGILNEYAMVDIRHSAIAGNHGWGIYALATTHVMDSTISANDRGGVHFDGNPASGWLLTLTFVTVADNAGGGIWSRSDPDVLVGVYNSIVALNPGGFGNCSGEARWDFGGFNLACDAPDSMTELGLGSLTRIGDTWVHPLLPGSPAVDSAIVVIDPEVYFLSRDQTGTARPQPVGGSSDIGAFELAGTTLSGEIQLPPSPATLPSFTFTRQANCRLGPNTLYDSVGLGQVGQQVSIEGLGDPAGWYYVLLPDAVRRCFVAGSTGVVTGPVDGLPVVPAPPLPVAPLAPELYVSTQVCDSTKYVVRLSWKDVADEDGYRVYRDGVLIATLAANASSYDDTSPDFNPHEYRVDAYNAVGSSSSATKKSEGCVY